LVYKQKLEVQGKARREAARRRNSECSRPTAQRWLAGGAAQRPLLVVVNLFQLLLQFIWECSSERIIKINIWPSYCQNKKSVLSNSSRHNNTRAVLSPGNRVKPCKFWYVKSVGKFIEGRQCERRRRLQPHPCAGNEQKRRKVNLVHAKLKNQWPWTWQQRIERRLGLHSSTNVESALRRGCRSKPQKTYTQKLEFLRYIFAADSRRVAAQVLSELRAEGIAIERENSHFRRPHSHLTPPHQRTPTNICIRVTPDLAFSNLAGAGFGWNLFSCHRTIRQW